MNSSPFRSLLGAIASGFVLSAVALHATTPSPTFQWTFDSLDGAPKTAFWVSGGAVKIANAGTGHVIFQAVGGVGPIGSGVLNCAANTYGQPDSAARITSSASALCADAELAELVVSLWIKPTTPRSEQPYARLFNIGTTLDDRGNPGLNIALHEKGLEVCVNGSSYLVELPAEALQQSRWSFIALAYDGLSPNPYFSQAMIKALNSERNCAVYLGDMEAPPSLIGHIGFNTGGPDFQTPVGPIDLNGLQVAIGASTAQPQLAFCGLIDDVRIYGSLLLSDQIRQIWESALPKDAE